MIISNSSIGMDSARTYTSVRREAASFETLSTTSFISTLKNKEEDSKEIKDKNSKEEDSSLKDTKNNFDDIFNKMKAYATSNDYSTKIENDYRNKIITQCIQYLLSLILGIDPSKTDDLSASSSAPASNGYYSLSDSGGSNVITITNTFTASSFYSETESTDFSTEGRVVTADGREINFNLNLSMSRSFTSYMETKEIQTHQFVDPLVINLDEDVAEVEDINILFDIDSDGEKESLSLLSSSSGYLSLDLNEDGIINDGSELFGTSSGDGFEDLSKYDSDGNGWIDEADEIFNKLKICVFDKDGNQTLYSLKDKNVGAISLKSADTEFSLNNLETNKVNARIRKTGIFLYETGEVGTMQHLDLAQ